MTADNGLNMWTIFARPKDYPHHFVVRRFWVTADGVQPTADAYQAESVEHARTMLPPGLFPIPRQDDDDPAIVETWT